MPFISTTDHQNFIRQFHLFLSKHASNGDSNRSEESLKLIKADIDKLEQLAAAYRDTYFHLQDLARQYKTVLKQTKMSIRRQQLKKMSVTK